MSIFPATGNDHRSIGRLRAKIDTGSTLKQACHSHIDKFPRLPRSAHLTSPPAQGINLMPLKAYVMVRSVAAKLGPSRTNAQRRSTSSLLVSAAA